VIERRLLAIYLQDHRAGAAGGVELARRLRGNTRDSPCSETTAHVCAEIEAALSVLDRLMDHLDVGRNHLKIVAAWGGEKLGRLKLNGRLRGYSPLSRLVELELLDIGLTGQTEMWLALHETLGPRLAEFDLPGQIERARGLRETVERLRLDAAAEAFAEETGSV
jgi:hypothetical protein